jgi:hypothetical protein
VQNRTVTHSESKKTNLRLPHRSTNIGEQSLVGRFGRRLGAGAFVGYGRQAYID